MKDLSTFREEYRRDELHEDNIKKDPLQQIELWLQDAIDNHIIEPNAMCVATSTADG
ncbi:MAG: pyridoxamine 5'-phosphate oxidase, partial [Proteiniphilum sp.]|nr:pyridoxamine 5'-phosphate oxidase [Proteiniphilum sp.]